MNAPVTEKSTQTLLKLKIEGDDGSFEYRALPESEFCCGFSPESDIQLGLYTKPVSARGKRRADEIIIIPSENSLYLKARSNVMINGVTSREGLLKEGSILRYGNCRIIFLGKEIQESEEISFRESGALFRKGVIPLALTASALLLLTLLFTGLWKVLPLPESAPVAGTAGAASADVPAGAASADVPAGAASADVPAGAASADVPAGAAGLVEAAAADKPEVYTAHAGSPALSVPLMIAPSDSLSGEKADILFIHAHPDDESLDFGALLALSRKKGLTAAVLLLTDGEAGIYRQNYSGSRNDLAAARVQEAAEAIGILGGLYYIRFGFKNHPYNTLQDKIEPEEILTVWGGETAAARKIADVIETLRPDIVVSPDRPSRANEHFEHEAAGKAAALSLEILRDDGGFLPFAHLVSIDPRQRELYTNLTAFPRKDVMDLQREALLSHRTQADASVFGIKMIEEFDFEYYSVKYWRLDDSPENFFIP